ncbi:hypothetical protein ACFWMS_28230 [Peribacillus butanolivorans]|uniref:hypothetical protein n=1 Tax=Peribacillus butanolivorans TaxID=421767 RepID=UPI0036638BE8
MKKPPSARTDDGQPNPKQRNLMTDTTPRSKHNAAINHLISRALNANVSTTFHAALELARSAPANSLEMSPPDAPHGLFGLGVRPQVRKAGTDLADAERAARDRHPAGEGLPEPLTREDIRDAGYSVADHFLDGLLVTLIRANALGKELEITSQVRDDWRAAVERGRSEFGSEGVKLLSPATLGFLERRTGRRSFTDSFDRDRDARAQDNLDGTIDSRDGDSASIPRASSERDRDFSGLFSTSRHRVAAAPVVHEVLHNSSPSVDGCGDPTVGEAGSVGGSSVSSTEKVDDPRISARYDRALNMIAISVDGEDDVYLPRDGAFAFSDKIRVALEVQAKLGGAA